LSLIISDAEIRQAFPGLKFRRLKDSSIKYSFSTFFSFFTKLQIYITFHKILIKLFGPNKVSHQLAWQNLSSNRLRATIYSRIIVHLDLKGLKILLDGAEVPRISDIAAEFTDRPDLIARRCLSSPALLSPIISGAGEPIAAAGGGFLPHV
jgi:hypothetical protein